MACSSPLTYFRFPQELILCVGEEKGLRLSDFYLELSHYYLFGKYNEILSNACFTHTLIIQVFRTIVLETKKKLEN